MMACTDYMRWLSPYIDDILAPDERRQLEGHLEGCAHCRGELASLQQMLQTLRTMEPPTVPELLPGIHERLQRTPWWHAMLQRFTAPWPASLPWHGIALATSTALALLIVVTPAYRVRRVAGAERRLARANETFQLAQAPAQASQFHRQANAARADTSSLDRKLIVQKSSNMNGDAVDAAKMPSGVVTSPASISQKLDDAAALRGRAERDSLSISEPTSRLATAADAEDHAKDRFADVDIAGGKENGASARSPATFGYGLAGAMTSGSGVDAVSTQRSKEALPAAPAVSVAESVVANGPTDSLASQPSEPKTEQVASPSPLLLQVQWRVTDLQAAASQVIEWVQTKQGLVVATNEFHLAIRLPSAAVAGFLQKFTSQPPEWIAPADPLWVTISLELSLSSE